MSHAALRSRLAFDHGVFSEMSGEVFSGEAYASADDFARRRNPISSGARSADAMRYRITFHVATLVGPGQWVPETVIGFDLGVRGYPVAEPATWLISEHVPFSPHFRRGSPVCIGEIWRDARGHMLLAQLCVHVARLLNWDEVARGGGYVGWNPAAVEYRRTHYGDRPLNADLRYPALPAGLTHGVPPSSAQFRAARPNDVPGQAPRVEQLGLFTPWGGQDG